MEEGFEPTEQAFAQSNQSVSEEICGRDTLVAAMPTNSFWMELNLFSFPHMIFERWGMLEVSCVDKLVSFWSVSRVALHSHQQPFSKQSVFLSFAVVDCGCKRVWHSGRRNRCVTRHNMSFVGNLSTIGEQQNKCSPTALKNKWKGQDQTCHGTTIVFFFPFFVKVKISLFPVLNKSII